jgi:hypothetical protein
MSFKFKEEEFTTIGTFQYAKQNNFNGKDKNGKTLKKNGGKGKKWNKADVKKGCTRSVVQGKKLSNETNDDKLEKLMAKLELEQKEKAKLKSELSTANKLAKNLQIELDIALRESRERQKQIEKYKLTNSPPKDKYGFTTRKQYRKWLMDHGFNLNGQDVNHIIASQHGGADHIDNYLYTTGNKYNRGIKGDFDAFNCSQAGKEMTKRAIAACKLAEKLKDVCPNAVEKRAGNKKRTYWSEGVHAGKTAEELIEQGQNWFRTFRLNLRNANKK